MAVAVKTAQSIFDDKVNKTQVQIDAAILALNNALTNFQSKIIKAGNPTALTEALADATTLYATAVEGIAVGEYASGSKAVFQTAIEVAQTVLNDKTNKTAQQLSDAKDALTQAVVAFGNGKVLAGDALALTTAIADATTLHTNAVEGIAVGQYASGSKVTLQAAIDAAQTVLNDKTNKTAQQLSDAKDTLTQAVVAFGVGEVLAGDASALTTTINDATTFYATAVEGIAVGEYASGSKAVFQTAIEVAQTVLNDKTNKTAQQLADAKDALTQAVVAFGNGKVLAGDASALTTAIADATTLHTTAVEGIAVGQYASGSKVTLQAAIEVAQTVLDDKLNKTTQQLADAKDALTQAVVAFGNGKVLAGDASALTTAIADATTLHTNAVEGIAVGQYASGSKVTLQAAIEAAQTVLDDKLNKTAQQLSDAKDALTQAVVAFGNSEVLALTGLTDVTIMGIATDSSNQITINNGESLVLTSSDQNGDVANITEDPAGTIKVTGVAAGGPIEITVQVTKEGQVIKTGTFRVTIVAPISITSKTITDLDFSSVYATQAKLVSKPVIVDDFTGNRKDFTIRVQKGERVDVIPVSISWKLSTDFSKGLAMGSVAESWIQQFYLDKDIANNDSQYTELMTRPVMATGNYENDQFYIGTFASGSQASITVEGQDWSYFFENNQAQGTDASTAKNRTFTIGDGIKTATISLTSKFVTIDALVNQINNRLTSAGVTALAEKVNETEFKITSTSATGNIIIDGANKADFFE